MNALKRHPHKLNTIKTKLEIGQPNVAKHALGLNW